jgi:hypothetical protein
MILLAADENFNNNIIRGLLRRRPDLDIARVQDAELSGADDPAVLEWVAREGRVLFTHDASTMTQYVDERIEAGLPMPGVFVCGQEVPTGRAIEDMLIIAECSYDGEWEADTLLAFVN